jgi:competence protein ComFC
VEAYPLDDRGLCVTCRQGIRAFDHAYAFGSYEGPLQKLIHLFKYGKVESLARPLGELILRALPRDLDVDHVIAIPMHWRKQWQRGFNQAALLAEPVARRYGLKLSGNLRRVRYTESQASLDEQSRRANLKNSFAVRRPEEITGSRILLVDDVFTTGATLRVAAEVLKNAGASHVTVLTLARVDRRGNKGFASSWMGEPQYSAVLAGIGAD